MSRLWETKIGFGGPWQAGKRYGQLPLFMVWRLYYDSFDATEPCDGCVLFSSRDWIGI